MRSLEDLLPRLTQATEAKKMQWDSNGVGFRCAIGERVISVWSWSSQDSLETSGISVNLMSDASVRATLLDAIVVDEYDSKYPQVEKLFSAARRSALKVDDVIAEIAGELDKL
jgi:hypothetical protein